ncbi:hypothetical protein B0J15DRAFT_464183 [Fusarium solani]|uniref:Uncharacterized protein n=1 Tax=Fusarium solani TaxID=169388 RepID=A0A9P9HW08_FUSSL|nr:uncharacterized protein B0J15DRAFT_464183 [Fusarium solani]KAH7264276.1 hypothetical protein B0J15DRAFT_464183 [Fusarium solani]
MFRQTIALCHNTDYRTLFSRGISRANAILWLDSHIEAKNTVYRPWFMMVVANSASESRERMLTSLIHPAIQPLAYQYLLGKDKWFADIFDKWNQIGLVQKAAKALHEESQANVAPPG